MSGRLAWSLRGSAVLAAAVLAAVLPFVTSDFLSFQLARMGIFLIAIMGLNILTGYTGQISIGHGAFMSVGGYTTAILASQHGIPDYWTVPLAGLLTGLVGLAFGVPALRLAGLYLALATFGVAVATPSIEKRWESLTKGSTGISLLSFHSNHWLYGVTWAFAAGLFVLAWLIVHGRLGRTFKALRDSEIAAVSMGVNPAFYKALAFGISAFYAGIAGALYTVQNAYVSPDTFPITLSLYLLIGAMIGGLGSMSGLLAGAAFVEFVPIHASGIVAAISPFHLDTKSAGVPSVLFGLVVVVLVLVLPDGASGLLRRLGSPLANRLYSSR